ncbi:MAG: type II toxin-antitoxin system VapC family toxin, partial [Chromatiaceae bacterium]|nr:type II toxin-antitoxin system VapC family toxin [Candidatus Thioaporhodococcus sediminis]
MATSIDLAVDTSALTAILLGEPEAPALLGVLTAAPRVGLCAPNRTELLLVIQARLGDGATWRRRRTARRTGPGRRTARQAGAG